MNKEDCGWCESYITHDDIALCNFKVINIYDGFIICLECANKFEEIKSIR